MLKFVGMDIAQKGKRLAVPNPMAPSELHHLLHKIGAFGSEEERQRALEKVAAVAPDPGEIDLGVKTIMQAVDRASQNADDSPGEFSKLLHCAVVGTEV